jgi:hypothetical protein
MQQFSIFIYPITKYHPETDSTNFDNHVLFLFKRANKKMLLNFCSKAGTTGIPVLLQTLQAWPLSS